MKIMTDTSTTFDESKVVRDHGKFAEKAFRDGILDLTVQPGDQFAPLTEHEAAVLVGDLFKDIDTAWVAERDATDLIEDGQAAGQAHSAAVAIAYLLSDNVGDVDYETLGENLLNDRRMGNDLEALDGWTGPGEISAIKRAQAAEWLRDRALLLAEVSEQDLPADAIAYQYSRAMALEDAADKIAGVAL